MTNYSEIQPRLCRIHGKKKWHQSPSDEATDEDSKCRVLHLQLRDYVIYVRTFRGFQAHKLGRDRTKRRNSYIILYYDIIL